MRYIILLILSCLICPSFGLNISTGSRFTGMANSCIMLKSPYEVFHNQAGLSDISKCNFGVSYTDRFNMDEFSSKSVFLVFPLLKTVSALDYSYYGYTEYYEEAIGCSVSKNLSSKLSLGMKIKYLHSFVKRYSRHSTEYNFEVGMQYCLFRKMRMGVHIANPVRKFNVISSTIFRTGLSWQCLKSILIAGEYVSIEDLPDFYTLGISWELYRNIFLCFGHASVDTVMHMGLTYKYRNLSSSISLYSNDMLGSSSAISVNYEF